MAKNVGFNIVLSVNGQDVVVNCKKGIEDLGRAIGTIPTKADAVRNTLIKWGAATNAIQGVYNSVRQITDVMNMYIQKSNAAAESQVKLSTVMRQRMSATDSDIASVNRLISAQVKEGVVSGTVQRNGMQQLATFVSHKEALAALLPAMNNLLVQQRGLNATSQDAVGIGNLMGKVLQGQTSALKRVGITFTDAEESSLKYGDEEQRAAVLAQVITNNVGNMNREMAKTDAGHMKQVSNELSSIEVKMGGFLSQYQSTIAVISQAGMAVTGLISIGTAMTGIAKATGLTSLALKTFQATGTMLATTGRIITAALSGATISATQLRYAIKGTILSLGLAGVAYYAISEALTYVIGKMDDMSDSTDDVNDKLTTTERLNNAVKEANDSVSSSVSEEKNRIKALSGIIESNTSTLADKKTAIMQLKSIIPGYNATIDKEGKVHINATNAIADHINALNALQRALAAYKVGQDIENELANKSYAYSLENQKLNKNLNNYNNLKNEFEGNKDDKYMYKYYTGLNTWTMKMTPEGEALLQKVEDAQAALKNQLSATTAKFRDLQTVQSKHNGYVSWKDEWLYEGANTQEERNLRSNAYNSVVLANGQPDKAASILFGRGENVLSPEEKGLEDGGGTVTTRTPRGHTGQGSSKTEIQKIDDQLEKLKEKYVTASDDAKAELSAKIQELENRRSQINLEILKSEVPDKITTSADADKQITYLEALRDVSKKDAIPAIDELIYKAQLFKLSLNRPGEKFQNLEDFDNEIAYEQKLVERASKDDAKNINAYIDLLESARGALKEGYAAGSTADLQASIARKQQEAGRTGDDEERARLQEEIGRLRRELALKTDYESGSAADLQAQIQDVDSQLNNKKLDVEARVELNQKKGDLQAQLNEITGGKVTIPAAVEPSVVTPGSTADKERSYNNANSQAQRLQTLVDIKAVGIDDARRQIDKLNEKLKELGLKPIEIHIETDAGKAKKELQENYGGSIAQTAQQFADLGKEMNASTDAGTNTAAMMSAIGQSLQQIGGDGEVAKVGATMAAIGQIILGFALAQRQAAEIGGAWGWLAFLGAGLAAVATTIATISSYATGGIVPGTSYTGDKVVAHVNSGEMILNAQQQARLFALANGALSLGDIAMQSPMQMYNVSLNTADVRGGGMIPKGQVEFKVKGRSLVGVLDADGKIGKKTGRRTVTIG